MPDVAASQMTIEEFFEWQKSQEDRYELVEGVPVKMMAGASNYHDAIVTNIIIALGNQLRGKTCRPMTADTAIRTKIKSLRRADVLVTCGELKPDSYEAPYPRLVVEVLSPSNQGVRWERKRGEYHRLRNLKYLLLVESREVQATLYTRIEGEWEPTDADDLDGVFELPEIGCRLAMRDVYDELPLEPPA